MGKTKRQVEEVVARHFPAPAVPDTIRKLPARTTSTSPCAVEGVAQEQPSPPLAATSAVDLSAVPVAQAASLGAPPAPNGPPVAALSTSAARDAGARPRRGTIEPLSADLYKVQFTASAALRDKLREAQDLLRHAIPDGNLAAIVERAVTALVEQVKKDRFGVGRRPRARRKNAEPKPPNRHVPVDVSRAVFERDGGQCAFVDARGHRCRERGWLEIDHTQGFALQPDHTTEETRLLCFAHNQYDAELRYGRRHMNRKRETGRRGTSEW